MGRCHLRKKRPGCQRGLWRVPLRSTTAQSRMMKYAYDAPHMAISTAMTDSLSLNLFQPICPDECQADGENCDHQSDGHDNPELRTRALQGLELIRVVHESGSIAVGEVMRSENTISRQWRHQEAGKRALGTNEAHQESDADRRCLQPWPPGAGYSSQQIQSQSRYYQQQRKRHWDKVGHVLIDRAEPRLGSKERQNPELRQYTGRVDCRNGGMRPRVLRGARHTQQNNKNCQRNDQVSGCAVQHFFSRVFADEEAVVHDDDSADVEKHLAELHPQPALRTVHDTPNQNQSANVDGNRTARQYYVRWAEDGDIETVGVMPPVVEGSRCYHREGSPSGNEGAEWTAKRPYP